MNTCANCRHWSPKTDKAMAKHWLAPCLLGPRWEYFPPQHGCNHHKLASAEVIEGRRVWLARAEV